MSLDANEDAVVGALKQSLVKSLTPPPPPPIFRKGHIVSPTHLLRDQFEAFMKMITI